MTTAGSLDCYLDILEQVQDLAGPDCDPQELTTLALVLTREANGDRFERRTLSERISIDYVHAHVICRDRGEIL